LSRGDSHRCPREKNVLPPSVESDPARAPVDFNAGIILARIASNCRNSPRKSPRAGETSPMEQEARLLRSPDERAGRVLRDDESSPRNATGASGCRAISDEKARAGGKASFLVDEQSESVGKYRRTRPRILRSGSRSGAQVRGDQIDRVRPVIDGHGARAALRPDHLDEREFSG
jgi:hypothetical protein